MNIPILYEDPDLFVINKPPGVVVNRAESVKGETIQDWAEQRLQTSDIRQERTEENKDFFERAGFVHRIDKETSGILIIAKNPESFLLLQAQFKEREVGKTYLALVHGNLVPDHGEIRAPIDRLPWNRERFGIVPEGKEAVTEYIVKKTFTHKEGKKEEMLSVVELHPHTGRTHQIRVHLKYINHPIVSNFQYAGRKTSRDDRKWAPRVMLHAWKIIFIQPRTQERLTIEAPIPEDMALLIGTV